MWSSDAAAGLGGALCLFPLCGDTNLAWVKLIAQSAIYTHFLLLWKALRYCSHLDRGAQTRLGLALMAVQVVMQPVVSDEHLLLHAPGCAELRGQLVHPRCRQEAPALPSVLGEEGGHPGAAPSPAPFSKHQQVPVLLKRCPGLAEPGWL